MAPELRGRPGPHETLNVPLLASACLRLPLIHFKCLKVWMEMMKSDEVLQKIDEEDGFRQHPTSEALGSPCGAGMAEKDTDDGVNTHKRQ